MQSKKHVKRCNHEKLSRDAITKKLSRDAISTHPTEISPCTDRWVVRHDAGGDYFEVGGDAFGAMTSVAAQA